MSDLDSANAAAPIQPQHPRTWDFMETLLVALIADGAFLVTAGVALMMIVMAHPGAASMSSAQFRALWTQGNMQGAGLIVGSLAAIAVLWIAVRKARRDFVEYLALNWPSRTEMLYAFALMALVVVAQMSLASAVHAPRPQTDAYLVVKSAGGLFILLIGGCIVAPIAEEFVVRGFMFRGWSESFLGPIGAILLTSALWGLNHTQYDWYWRFDVFLTGLALGHLRWRSNSTWLTVMIHSAINTWFFFAVGPYR